MLDVPSPHAHEYVVPDLTFLDAEPVQPTESWMGALQDMTAIGGLGVGFGVGRGVRGGVGLGLGLAVGTGVGSTVGEGVGDDVDDGLGEGLGRGGRLDEGLALAAGVGVLAAATAAGKPVGSGVAVKDGWTIERPRAATEMHSRTAAVSRHSRWRRDGGAGGSVLWRFAARTPPATTGAVAAVAPARIAALRSAAAAANATAAAAASAASAASRSASEATPIPTR